MNSPFEKEEAVCDVCDGEGEIEESCSCTGMSPQYECPKCGNCGRITKACPQCSVDDYDQSCYDEDHRDDPINEELAWGGMDNDGTY